MKIAVWNIEKSGQSSTIDKQSKVNAFVDGCCRAGYDIIFLCEVHSARIDDYLGFVRSVYPAYDVHAFAGGHSNAYVLLIRQSLPAEVLHDSLLGLNREAVVIQIHSPAMMLGLGHFKSGQTGLTKSQLSSLAGFLESTTDGRWAITGDMNWDFAYAGALTTPTGSMPHACWTDITQAKGGVLDWCLAGWALNVRPAYDTFVFREEFHDMSGPDHRPVTFEMN